MENSVGSGICTWRATFSSRDTNFNTIEKEFFTFLIFYFLDAKTFAAVSHLNGVRAGCLKPIVSLVYSGFFKSKFENENLYIVNVEMITFGCESV